MRKSLLLLALVAMGCGPNVSPNPEPTPISGKVTLGGKPVSGVMLNLQPTGPGSLPKIIAVNEGSFQAELNPGKYAYFFSRGPSAETFESIPADYKEASLDREIEVVAGEDLEFDM